MNVHTAIVPDVRRPLKDGRYPLKLRVTYQRKRRYYALSHDRRQGIDFNVTHFSNSVSRNNSASEWDRVNSNSPRSRYRDIKLLIPVILKEADEIISKINPFTFEAFEKAYHGTSNAKDLFGLFDSYIAETKDEGRISTSISYKCTLNSLKQFDGKADFHNVTPAFINKYETWMVDQGRSITTVGIYLRSLRAIFNLALKQRLTLHYPFKAQGLSEGYEIPTGTNIKKALDIEEIGRIMNYTTVDGTEEDKAKDLWIFSYFSNGMNIKDICNLRIRDVDLSNMIIKYARQKTKRTSRTQTKIEIDIVPETLLVMEKWGNLNGDKADFVFPFFYEGITPEKQRVITQNIVKQTNKHINIICGKVGIKQRVNTYHARHSFANILKQSGAPIEFISESLGHADYKTTENYLKSFSSEYRRKWKDKLNPNHNN